MSFVSNLFSKPKAPKLETPPKTDTAAVQEREAEARRRAALSRGRGSTILTGQGGGLGSVG